jgi:phosphomannomutase
MEQDPDPETRSELEDLIKHGDLAALAERFSGTLQFGTAGLRGTLGAGPNRMNRVVVMRAAAGLAAWLRTNVTGPSVVIGFDARRKSDQFARDAAEILAGAGVRVFLFAKLTPTPVLAFTLGELGADSGLMITASHNPKDDNGIKVYVGDTSPIAEPVDAEIASHIGAVGDVRAVPRSQVYEHLHEELIDEYVAAVSPSVAIATELSIVYTPLHGVGLDVFARVAARCGFTIDAVAEQSAPDADFPTVPFPNPEEPGAMDAALALAEERAADVVVAHDPDADRCAVAVRHQSELQVLTGDELGILLADHLLRRGVQGCYANSVVSSDLLGRLAHAHGQRWQQTLSGFKWIGKIPDLAYGYEEALGYCVTPEVSRDKDGIAAAVTALGMIAELKAEGLTLLDRLEAIYDEHGHHLTGQVAVRFETTAQVAELMQRLRDDPRALFNRLAVTTIEDFSHGHHELPTADVIRLGLDFGRIIVRPSGTEPKLKCYVEIVADSRDEAEPLFDEVMRQVRAAMTTGRSR